MTKPRRNPSSKAKIMDQNASPRRGFSCRPKFCESALWQKDCLHDSQYKVKIVSTSHVPFHKAMLAERSHPPAWPKKFRQVLSANVTRQNSSFARFLDHAIFAPRTRPWRDHFSPSINALGSSARTISFLKVLTPHWQNLSKINRAKPKLWIKTCHHVADFRFDQNFAKAPCDKKIACAILDTKKESSPQAMSPSIKRCAERSHPPAGPKTFRQVPSTNVTHQNSSFSRFLDHAISAPRTRPWRYHFPPSINFLGSSARTISFLNVLTPHWQNLGEIHRAKPKLWTKTRHHVADFLVDQNFAKAPCDKKIACTIPNTK